MCDYSLCGLPNRLANVGDQLVVYRFQTGTIGLASREETEVLPIRGPQLTLWRRIKLAFKEMNESRPVTAVCVPPGAMLALADIPPDLQRSRGIHEKETVVFVQTSANVHMHRDGVRFSDGATMLLQALPIGISADVLWLGDVPVNSDLELALMERE